MPHSPQSRAEPACAADFAQRASELLEQRKIAECLACTDQAILLGAEPLSLSYLRWMCFMLRGEFDEAWRESDRSVAAFREGGQSQQFLPPHLRRVWNGPDLDGKRVLVRCYHGLGDTIQFVRFLPSLARRALSVHLQCQPELAPLLRSSPAINECCRINDSVDVDFDVEIELMELAHALRTNWTNLPRDTPYLFVPGITELGSSNHRARPNLNFETLKIGIAWSSGDWDPKRNIPLSELAPLKEIPRIALFRLQHGLAAVRDSELQQSLRIETAGSAPETVVATANTISSMDLVISVDTMVAHLAGALGRPVWVLLPFSADWRWMLDRSDSPWYPAMRLFRQPEPGNWKSAVSVLIENLGNFRDPRYFVSAG